MASAQSNTSRDWGKVSLFKFDFWIYFNRCFRVTVKRQSPIEPLTFAGLRVTSLVFALIAGSCIFVTGVFYCELCNVLKIMHCVSLAILSQLSRFHPLAVGTN